jgi:pimeloyl-ACP methyl ester carboxylesterase
MMAVEGMRARTMTIDLADGRRLRAYDGGDPAGRPVVVHHGTPEDGQLWEPWIQDAAARGIRLVGYDRPGYGGSTVHPGRRVADAASDVLELVDALGIQRFATWGASGGGPHALACAALCGERVIAAASLAGLAPFDADGLNFLKGMGHDNLVEFGAALQGREAIEPVARRWADEMLAAKPADLADLMRSLVSDADAAALDRGFADFWSACAPEVFAQGIAGWVDDDMMFVEPFGFDPAAISVPVLIRHGREDRFVPVTHGEWYARTVPDADVRITVYDGHLTLVTDGLGDIHEWLVRHFDADA